MGLCKSRNIGVNYLTTHKDKIVSKSEVQGFYWNPAKQEIDLDCLQGVSAIINLAGTSISKRWTADNKSKIITSRLDALRTLHSALEKVDTTKIISFVSASAIGIYPNSLTKFYEEDEKGTDESFLGAVVKRWEAETDTFDHFDFPVAKIRIGLVMSAKGGALTEMAKPIHYYMGAAFGSGEQWQSWIHIADLARMFLFVIDNGLNGIYNGVGPNPVTNYKLVREIAIALDKPILLPNIPRFVLKSVLGEMSYLLFASQRVCSKKIEEEGFIFAYQNIGKTLEKIYSGDPMENGVDSVYNQEYI